MKNKTKMIIVIFIILIITSCSIILTKYHLENKKIDNINNKEEKEELKNNQESPYDKSPDYIKKAYNLIDPFINTDRILQIYNGMYQDKTVTAETLDNESKTNYLAKRIYEDGYFKNKEYYAYEEDNNLKKTTKEEADKIKDSNMYYPDHILEKYPDVKKEVFDKYALNLLGEKNIEYKFFSLKGKDVYIGCIYNEEFYCQSGSGGGTGPRPEYTRTLIEYKETDDELLIYDKSLFYIDLSENYQGFRYYFKTLEDFDKAYSAEGYKIADDKYLVTKKEIDLFKENDTINKEVLQEFGILYESKFEKNEHGDYYWIYSKPVK